METEMKQFLMVCASVLVSLSYSYGVGKKVRPGFPRFMFLVPVLCQFLYFPLILSSVLSVGPISFIISWLGTFKLLLFAFDKGPLSSKTAAISLRSFVAIALLPVKIRENQTHNLTIQTQKSSLHYVTKCLFLVILGQIYDYRHQINPKLMQLFCCLQIYLTLELGLFMAAYMARAMLELDVEAPFNEPYFASSLQDFWGRRWNLVVSGILRPTVYDPVLLVCTRIVGRKLARTVAVLSTFFVSGVMHELTFYYFGRVRPTWEVFWFFNLHGVCVIVEIAVKKSLKDKCRIPAAVSCVLTVGFVLVTVFLLFLPQFVRFRVYDRAFEEYAVIAGVLKESVSSCWISMSIYSS